MKITVVTASYNSGATILDTLDSVAAQGHPDIEHLVIDGASHDNTVSLVRGHRRRPERCLSEPDRGTYDAMNKGLRLATGDVVGFINSDDFYASADVLAKVSKVFADPSVDACYGDLCYVKHDQPDVVVRYWVACPFRPGLFLTGWCQPHPTFFVRRRVYEELGGFDLGYSMGNDVELMVRFLEVHRVKSVYMPELLVNMRMGGASNQSWSAVLLQNREVWRALKAHRLRPRLLPFVVGKLLSRGRQFLSRPP